MTSRTCGIGWRWRMLVAGSVIAIAMQPALAAVNAPQPLPYRSSIAPPQDRAFNGTILLEVDARDIAHRLFRVHESIPVQAPGRLTLLHPEWEPSSHARTLSAANLAGLEVRAGSQRLEWRRDALDMHAFHIDVPQGVDHIDVEFQYVTRGGEALLRPDMVVVQWQRMLLYPAGWFARNIPVQARLRVPAGLHAVSSLEPTTSADDSMGFASTSLETLLDAPVIAARHLRSFLLSSEGQPPLRLHLLADDADALHPPAHDLDGLRRMADETRAVFGRPPYHRFDAMVVLSDAFPSGGTEHAASAEITLPADFFATQSAQLNNLDLIAHEHVHAWNGRARVPADQWTPTPNQPIRNSLLWVYEGQTEFWGRVLAARSGFRSHQQTLDKLALDAAEVQGMRGRAWKTLRDTTNDPLYVSGRATVWPDWQRRKDYYIEGVLLWLDIDMTLREGSAGRIGLDALASDFFATAPGQGPSTYTFDDLCTALHALLPIDWAAYLDARLDAHTPLVLQGLERAGWELVYDSTPTATFLQHEAELHARDLRDSIGMVVDARGQVRSVTWDGPAYRAGIAPGATVETVNGAPFSSDALLSAVAASAERPVALTSRDGGEPTKAELDYHDGLRYPHLRRIDGHPDRLTQLLQPRAHQRLKVRCRATDPQGTKAGNPR